MYINEHNVIAQSHQRTHDLRRAAAARRLAREAHEAHEGNETPAGRTFSFASILRRFVSAQPQPAAEAPIKAPTLRRV